MNNLRTFPPKFLQKPSPYFFHGAFAPSFIWRRRLCLVAPPVATRYATHIETSLGSRESPVTRHNLMRDSVSLCNKYLCEGSCTLNMVQPTFFEMLP